MASLAARGSLGGVLMGLANLVPGISGGTMLLAAGVYRGFVEAVAEVTTLRFRSRSLLLLGVVGGAALLAILLLAGPTKALVKSHRWEMYSLFLGLTFGGVPIVWRMAKPPKRAFWIGAAVGFLLLALLAIAGSGGGRSSTLMLGVAGVAGAAAMVLPGISGAYLMLVLGQYETVLGAVEALKERRFSEALPVIGPVAVGALVGVVGVSNLVRWALHHHAQATLGFLLGLLFGSLLGLYPFQDAGKVFTPSLGQVAGALALLAAGYAATRLIDRIGRA